MRTYIQIQLYNNVMGLNVNLIKDIFMPDDSLEAPIRAKSVASKLTFL